jgi:hypothetical protein
MFTACDGRGPAKLEAIKALEDHANIPIRARARRKKFLGGPDPPKGWVTFRKENIKRTIPSRCFQPLSAYRPRRDPARDP